MGTNFSPQNIGGEQRNTYRGGNVKIKIGSVIIIGIVFIAFLWYGVHNSQSNSIVGTWQTEGGYTLVFQSNGQYASYGGRSGTYSYENGTLTLCPTMESPEIYQISISMDSITIYNFAGDTPVTLNRVGK